MSEDDRFLELSPEKTLTFTWDKSSDQPLAYLKASNTSTTSFIAYKVKTTAPKRYVVRPPQGVIEPGSEASIKLTMVLKDAESLWNEALEEKAKGGDNLKCDDKFLVQTTVISGEYYRAELSDKDDKAIATSLQKLWKTLGDEDKKLPSGEKKAIKSSKLQTTFVFPTNMSAQSTPSSTPSSASSAPSVSSMATQPPPGSPLKSSPHGSAEAVFAELSALRKKYDDLVAYTVVLTGERDFLQQEVDDKGASLRKAESERPAGDGVVAKEAPPSSGFSFIHLIAVALIAFIVGRLIA